MAKNGGTAVAAKDFTSLRSTIEYLRDTGELVETEVEVDPALEMAAIQKRFDGGKSLLFQKVKSVVKIRQCLRSRGIRNRGKPQKSQNKNQIE